MSSTTSTLVSYQFNSKDYNSTRRLYVTLGQLQKLKEEHGWQNCLKRTAFQIFSYGYNNILECNTSKLSKEDNRQCQIFSKETPQISRLMCRLSIICCSYCLYPECIKWFPHKETCVNSRQHLLVSYNKSGL